MICVLIMSKGYNFATIGLIIIIQTLGYHFFIIKHPLHRYTVSIASSVTSIQYLFFFLEKSNYKFSNFFYFLEEQGLQDKSTRTRRTGFSENGSQFIGTLSKSIKTQCERNLLLILRQALTPTSAI